MNRFLLFFFLAIAFSAGKTTAQSIQVPQHPRLEKESDYATYTKEVIACIDWMEKTPLDKEADKRKEVSRFLMLWIQGTPDVTINIHDYVAKFSDVDPEFLIMFMCGWTRYVLQQKDTNELADNLAGVQSVLRLYEVSRSQPRNDEMDKLQAMQREGKLKDWVQQQIKK